MENKSNVLLKRYELGRLLGQGTFAKVYYARSLITNQSVAIKVIDKEKIMKVGLVDQIKREISIMTLVKHPNVIQLYEVMATKTKIYFVMEYAKGGELFDKVAKGKLKEEVAWKYFNQLINAVDFCHSRGVYHRDIKPENLLLDENDNLKASDFGLSALAESKHQDGLLHTTCGTPAYVAPEVINRKGYDGAKADIWSCGVVLYVLLDGYLPFHDSNLMELYRKIGRADFKCPSWFPPEVKRLLFRILDPNPSTRASIDKIKESTWYKKGLKSKHINFESENKDASSLDTETSSWHESASVAAEGKQEPIRPPNLNAFDIISLSVGFDLSGLFEEDYRRREARFIFRKPATVIVSKLEEIAKKLRMKVKKRDAGLFRLEGLREGRKGILSIDAEIFEVTPSFHLVEVKLSNGDSMEYQKILKDDIKPALQDIAWVWQDDQQQQPHQQQQHHLQPHEVQHERLPQLQQEEQHKQQQQCQPFASVHLVS
ncbi:CBL-interacting serine/threonine-protein kinase 10 [Morus notabilis]|uniref:non-specific serine/threonine protein kinase n=1 Tax=Morus notabilis TaxID=981085 RepID=W9RZU9_9ROSA|nr:CBL-interacting protein kinase 2 [Morus notabilis]XP_024029304.1 CBL-interacting protein kinase 2 [Morus notabilis]XP_024029305.1 CBL-interacting protein kinase 2 [Morus notabilis]EXC19561.1 CBL-interacting serine/threonine-protein kinase 10 [Morus notabilis]